MAAAAAIVSGLATSPNAQGQQQATVIQGGTLIDGNGGAPLKSPVIVLEGRRIKAVGEKGKVKVPAKAEHIDCKGLTLLPGLMDVHLHTSANLRRYLVRMDGISIQIGRAHV